MIVNLSDLEFFGTAGFSALHTINVRCAGADVRGPWCRVRQLSRLLRICDPDNAARAAPVTESVREAQVTS